jgi:hypothetical protein
MFIFEYAWRLLLCLLEVRVPPGCLMQSSSEYVSLNILAFLIQRNFLLFSNGGRNTTPAPPRDSIQECIKKAIKIH